MLVNPVQIKTLEVVLRRGSQGYIEARARQQMPEGIQEGSNLLKKKRPHNFLEARTLVRAEIGRYVGEIVFVEESPEWERS